MSEQKQQNRKFNREYEHRKQVYGWTAIVAILIFVFWIATPYLIIFLAPAQASLISESFNAVNALFAGLAFLGVVVAVLLQQHELELQRQELKLTRRVMRDQQKELREQSRAFSKQNFEATFFALLKVLREIEERFESEFFTKLVQRLWQRIRIDDERRVVDGIAETTIRYNKSFSNVTSAAESVYRSKSDSVGPYLRTLYNLLKYVARSQLDLDEKKFYSNLIRAQLSDDQQFVLFYYGLTTSGTKCKEFIEEFSLLKHLDLRTLIHASHANNILNSESYKHSAYGRNIQQEIDRLRGDKTPEAASQS